MKKIKLLILFLCGFLTINTAFATKKFSVIVNNSNDYTGSVKGYFLLSGEAFDKWPNGAKVEPYDIKNSDSVEMALARKAFIEKVLSKTVGTYINHWRSQESKGRTRKPIDLSSWKDILNFVSNKKGGVSFIPSELINGSVRVVSEFEI